MPQADSVQKVGELVVRFKTSKFGVTVYRQRFDDGCEQKYARSFYYAKTVAKKMARFPLGYDMRTAEKLAEEIAGYLSIPSNTLDMAIAKYNPRHSARANKIATFQDVLDTYEKALPVIGRKGKAVSKPTFKGYKSFLGRMLRKVEAYRTGKPFKSFFGQSNIDFSPWFGQPIDILTTRFAMDFKLASMPEAPNSEDEPDEEEVLTAKISADSTLRSARALFSKQALRYYAEVGLVIPDLSGFMSEPEFGAKKYFQVLPPEVIINIMRESLALRMADVDTYRAFLLTMHVGLRRAEAKAFRKDWMRQEDTPIVYVVTEGTFNPKHGRGRKVSIEPWVMAALEELGPIQNPESLDKLIAWVKTLIPEANKVNKPVHELRKCWVSAKAKTDGILAASQQAGHADTKTTTTHYADNLLSDRLVPLWKEPTDKAILKFKSA